MQLLLINQDNTYDLGIPMTIMAKGFGALDRRGFKSMSSMGDGIALIEGDLVRPIPTVRFKDRATTWNVVLMTRGLRTRLQRPSGEAIDFGLTAFGKVVVGPAGQVSFKDHESRPIPEDVRHWLAHGERGDSSEALCFARYGVPEDAEQLAYPRDPDDLRRCLKFLDHCPDAREGLPQHAPKSREWDLLMDHWAELETLMREEGPTGKLPKTYALMKTILAECAPTAEAPSHG